MAKEKKKVAILIAEGFEELEAITVFDIMHRTDIEPLLIALEDTETVSGSFGVQVVPDGHLKEISAESIDAVVLPGGLPGAYHLRDSEEVIALIREMDKQKKLIGAICAAPLVLEKSGIMKHRQGTSYPGLKETCEFAEYLEAPVVVDGHIITSRGPATAVAFALALIACLLGNGRRDAVAEDILWPL